MTFRFVSRSAQTGERMVKRNARSSTAWGAILLIAFLAMLMTIGVSVIQANDWPQWRGRDRLGLWEETGIVDAFPDTGLKVRWRVKINGGYAGPAVTDGRVFVTDARHVTAYDVVERVLCLDEETGRVLWTREWETNYTGMLSTWATGPRATPTVDGDRVYVLGAAGVLHALNVETGAVLWRKDYVEDYDTEMPPWGISGAPLVDGDRLIALVGGQPDAKVVAFDKMTGSEIWRALSSNSEPGYSQPIIFHVGNTRQLIIWHPAAVSSLDPETGAVYWEQPYTAGAGMSVATPVLSDRRLLVSSFYNGSMMLTLDDEVPRASLLWKGTSDNEILTDGLHAVVTTPVIDGDYVYGIGSYGQFRGLNAATGERLWETQEVTAERARWASGFMIRHGDRFFINNDRGELIIARATPEGYQEVSRTTLIEPTTNPGNRRKLGVVNWSHPAYANQHVYARNDEEILKASLAAADYQ